MKRRHDQLCATLLEAKMNEWSHEITERERAMDGAYSKHLQVERMENDISGDLNAQKTSIKAAF